MWLIAKIGIRGQFFKRSEPTSLHSLAYTKSKPEDLLARNKEIKFEE
jgi:hypothetical protein